MPLRYIIPAALLLAGCSVPTLPSLAPYKLDVQQGNVVTQDMISKLKPGMTRSQVRFALGTPLVVDPFRTNRWDYVYVYEKAGTVTEQRHIVVIFEDDKLARIEGDVVPAKPGGATDGGVKIDKPAAAPPRTQAAAPLAPGPVPRPEAAAQEPGGSKRVTGADGAVATGGAGAETGAGTEQAKEERKETKPAEERRGWFGRILEKLGF